MAITATSSAQASTAYLSLFKNLNAASSKPSTLAPNPPPSDPAALLKTATNSVFQMSDLLRRTRSLANAADGLRPGDSNGLSNMTKQMNSMLDEFNAIAGEKSADKAKAAPTLSEVQSTLGTMQTNLRENIRKVGTSAIAAVATGAFTNKAAHTDSWSSWLASIKVNQKYLQ